MLNIYNTRAKIKIGLRFVLSLNGTGIQATVSNFVHPPGEQHGLSSQTSFVLQFAC
jgi:hypothetical protein